MRLFIRLTPSDEGKAFSPDPRGAGDPGAGFLSCGGAFLYFFDAVYAVWLCRNFSEASIIFSPASP